MIRNARKAKGLTQQELGERLGLDKTRINKFESGKFNLTLETLQKIAEALEEDLTVEFRKR